MTAKRILQSIVVVVLLAGSLASSGSVQAWSGCPSYITVGLGDSWSTIAAACGTTSTALQAANPGVGWWLTPGQVLYIPTANTTPSPAYTQMQVSGTYVIQWGDTLGDIATRYGVSLSDLLAVNPQIWNINLIFPGDMINLPANAVVPSSTYIPSTYNPYDCNPSPYNPSACGSTTYNPSNYDPSTCNPSPYNPSACNPYGSIPATITPTPVNSSLFSNLKVTSGPGLLVRSGPGMNFSEIKSPFVSAVNKSEWRYLKGSATMDSTGLVWVEVALSPLVSGYSTGWIMVRDQLGTHFTDPNIDP